MTPFQFVIISSPSGAGKTTLSKMLLGDRRMGKFCFSISHTTRPPRKGEVHGLDYYFIDRTAFRKMVAKGEFAEHARVHGNYYGTSLEEIRRRKIQGAAGIIFDIDYQGARQIKKKFPDALAIFILPPSIHELRKRLEKRGTETRKNLEIRLKNAIREIRQYAIFDFIVVNDRLESTYLTLSSIIKNNSYSRQFSISMVKELLSEWKEQSGNRHKG
ncbi:MAG: guanylate kinase [Pseudomonadota bacterium]